MRKIREKFIEECYEMAIKLKENFRITEDKEWDESTILLELGVQFGHIFDIKCDDNNLKEKMININDLGDEISDVLLQIMYLGYLKEVNFKEKIDFEYDNIDGIIVLYGQIVETVMEENSYRFNKKRIGFETRLDFIRNRIQRMYLLVINYARANKIDIITEFKKMEKDAKGFLKEYEKKHKM